MQQAETVRLVGQNKTRHSVTELPRHTIVIGWLGRKGASRWHRNREQCRGEIKNGSFGEGNGTWCL